MKVYVLGSGRCGEKTLATACSLMTNYSVRADEADADNQIVINKQLIWSVDELEGDAMLVHLYGDLDYTAEGYRRFGFDEPTATRWTPALKGKISQQPEESELTACLEYVNEVNAKISAALATREHSLTIDTSEIADDFRKLWQTIGAEGNLDGALDLFRMKADLADYMPLLPEPEDATT